MFWVFFISSFQECNFTLLGSLIIMFYFLIGDGIVESGQWEVPGYASGLYMSLAIGGKVMWEEATM